MSASINLEVKSGLPVQVQLVRTDGKVYNWGTKTWVLESAAANAGLTAMTAETDPKRLGWNSLVVPIDTSIPDGVYRAVFYGVDPVNGPNMICDHQFGIVGGMPYSDGVLSATALPPSPTDLVIKFYTSTVSAHKTPAGSYGDLMNRLSAFLTKQGF